VLFGRKIIEGKSQTGEGGEAARSATVHNYYSILKAIFGPWHVVQASNFPWQRLTMASMDFRRS
jgi:predicted TIM-barrel fold metal-dependent hydrolase